MVISLPIPVGLIHTVYQEAAKQAAKTPFQISGAHCTWHAHSSCSTSLGTPRLTWGQG